MTTRDTRPQRRTPAIAGTLLLALLLLPSWAAGSGNRTGERRDLGCGGLFVFIGADPCTEWLDGALAKDDDGFLLTGVDLEVTHLGGTTGAIGRPALPLETSLPGVFRINLSKRYISSKFSPQSCLFLPGHDTKSHCFSPSITI